MQKVLALLVAGSVLSGLAAYAAVAKPAAAVVVKTAVRRSPLP